MWPNACAAAIRGLFARFPPIPQTQGESFDNGLITQYEYSTGGPDSQAPMNSESHPQAAKSFAEHEGGNQGLQAAPIAFETGRNVMNNVNAEPESHSNAFGLRDATVSTQTALNPHDTTDTYLDNIFPFDKNLDNPDVNLFEGFDIPFWMDDDLYASLPESWDFT